MYDPKRSRMSCWNLLLHPKGAIIETGRARRGGTRRRGRRGGERGPLRDAAPGRSPITGRESPMFGLGPTPRRNLPKIITSTLAATGIIWLLDVCTGKIFFTLLSLSFVDYKAARK